MSEKKVRLTDVGTDFRVTMTILNDDGSTSVFDISSYTTIAMEFLEPDGTTIVTKTSVLIGGGAGGIMSFVNPDTSLFAAKPGLWHRRGHVAKAGEDFRNKDWIPFRVKASLE